MTKVIALANQKGAEPQRAQWAMQRGESPVSNKQCERKRGSAPIANCGVDLLPSNIKLSGMEMTLNNTINREKQLREYLKDVKKSYDYVLIDCSPSLNIVTLNALTAADSVIIPVQSHYLPAKGMTQLLQTINRVKRGINPKLRIGGVLLTMVDSRTNLAKEIAAQLRAGYGRNIRIFDTQIPLAISAAEASAAGKSIYLHDGSGKAAKAYEDFTKEVIAYGRQIEARHQDQFVR